MITDRHYWYCKSCGTKTDNKICQSCVDSKKVPCSICGQPIPTLTRTGNIAKRDTCVSCTARLTADTRRIGKTCVVCGNRFQSNVPANQKSVCDDCLKIQSACVVCGNPTSKYRPKGIERKTCSVRCAALNKLPLVRHNASKKANQTKWANHIYKSHQNKIARTTSEYTDWRAQVFERDNYTCQDCGDHNFNGRGQTIQLHPHHIKPFATHPESRYDISNGVTLCPTCHRKRHKHVFIGKTKKKVNQR